VAEGRDLRTLPGVGESLAGKIHEILRTGTCRALEDLKTKVPPGLADLLGVPGLGPRKAKLLYDRLGITSLDELRRAAEEGRIRDLPGMGERTEQNILRGLRTLEAEAGRVLLKEAADLVAGLGRHLEGQKAIRRWEVAGSFRRRRETVGDLDVLVQAARRDRAAEAILGYPAVEDVLARGKEKVSVRLAGGLQVDFRFVRPEAMGAALMYFTGSKAHNIQMRRRAQARGLKLNEYGLFRGRRRLAGRTEEEVFAALDLPWIPPELREDRGEIDAAERGLLPNLITRDDLRGDLHAHTDATDGTLDLEALVAEARRRGYAYIAVTDHSKAVAVAGGLDADALRRQADRIRELDAGLRGFWVLAGIEVDILKDGRLDLPEKVLAGLDWVVASVHSYFDLPEDRMTDRLLAAVRSGVVHCLGHPLARLIGRRDPIRVDIDRLLEACRETGVALEINSYPDRLDLPDVYCKRAKEAGCRFAISTDAHKPADLDLIEYGVAVARRGWLEKEDVLNTRSAADLRAWLERAEHPLGRRPARVA